MFSLVAKVGRPLRSVRRDGSLETLLQIYTWVVGPNAVVRNEARFRQLDRLVIQHTSHMAIDGVVYVPMTVGAFLFRRRLGR